MSAPEKPRNTDRKGMEVERYFTRPNVHPYQEVTWERSDVVMRNWRDNSINFEQLGVEFPSFWSISARQIVASKYFRGQLGTPGREWSLKQLIDRVADTYTEQGERFGYFASPADAKVFNHELKYLLVHQMFSFNSPVWFNVGTDSPWQVSACYLLSVEDNMNSILNWYREEGLIFKGGSGAGVNLSRLRASCESLQSSGGRASGPVSFMRGADASAGTIKSGGRTRRAAKLVCLDSDHPDIVEFITAKSREERKIRALKDVGFDMDLGGEDAHSVQYQNANNSVMVSDEFMRAVESGVQYPLRTRTTGETVRWADARETLRLMAQAAWECADPGIMFDDTINSWHSCPESGRISTSNPCSEFLHLDNSSCNLASLNLIKFLDADLTFDVEKFVKATETVITAMEISVSFADFPTEKITEVTREFRHLGIGYTNLGTLLMAMGDPYDSEQGRSLAAAITSLMTAVSYRRSSELAAHLGAYDGFDRNAESHRAVVNRHRRSNRLAQDGSASRAAGPVFAQAGLEWAIAACSDARYRNAHISVLAPTGTISFGMDADTTGIEPDFALVKTKKLSDGGTLEIVNRAVPRALSALGYPQEQVEAIENYVAEHGHVVGAPSLQARHYPVFDCAVGDRSISPEGHVRMVAAVQPFLSGAVSKTVNVPESASVEDIERMFIFGWKQGLKSLAIYRDGSKGAQPLSVKKKDAAPHEVRPVRHRLPAQRPSITTSFEVGSAQGYLTASSYPDNGLGEIFLKLGKQGSTLSGIMDAFSIAISIGLQYGIPLESYVEKFTGMQFEPRGMTKDSDVRFATSLMDYVFRRLALDHLPRERREAMGILSSAERSVPDEETLTGSEEVSAVTQPQVRSDDPGVAPLCMACGVSMVRAGSCFCCEQCGSTSGCS